MLGWTGEFLQPKNDVLQGLDVRDLVERRSLQLLQEVPYIAALVTTLALKPKLAPHGVSILYRSLGPQPAQRFGRGGATLALVHEIRQGTRGRRASRRTLG